MSKHLRVPCELRRIDCLKTGFAKPKLPIVIKVVFFDAVGTLFQLTGTVGDHYALVAREVGLNLDSEKLNNAFLAAWKQMPARGAIDGPRDDDDRGWWR